VTALHGTAGDVLAVGSDFIEFETGTGPETATTAAPPAASPEAAPTQTAPPETAPPETSSAERAPTETTPTETTPTETTAHAAGDRSLAAPAVRERARSLGIDLSTITGSGPDGHVTHEDLDRLSGTTTTTSTHSTTHTTATTQIPFIGLRRKIGAQVAASASRIPHITYVDEVDVTQLEQLRTSLAAEHPEQTRVTVLPFVMRAIVMAVADQPLLNATFDDETEIITTYVAVNIGIATQTPNGLIVPVVRDAHARDLWRSAAELARVTAAARNGTAQRDELSGSTITITSLGAMGGLVTTPIINHPEVAIVGINKMQVRPVWDGAAFAPRTMMNLSCSFDHRIIDGWVAASFVQRIKALLEAPALLFVPAPHG